MTTKKSPFSVKYRWVGVIAGLLLLTLACGLPSAIQSLAPADTPAPAPAPTITPTPQPLPPALVEADPPPGSRLSLDGALTLYFNQAMQRASVEEAFSAKLYLPNGQATTHPIDFTWLDDSTLVVSPAVDWLAAKDWSMEIAASARAANGLTMLEAVSFNYPTAPPLEVVQILPESGLTDVDPSSAVVVTFNQPVVSLGADPNTLPGALIIEPPPDGHGEWVNTSTYIFYPETALFGGATYSISVNPKLSSTSGASLTSALEWSFSTASPRLVSIEPGDGSSAVPLDASFKLTFNQPMDTINVEGHFTMHDSDGEYIPGVFEWEQDDTVVVFTPSEVLSRNTEYTLQLPFGAQARGGTPLGVSYSAAVDTVPGLMITSTDPLQGGFTGIYSGVTLYFNSFVLDDDDIDLLQYISITPEVPDLYYWLGWEGRELNINGSIDPLTEYQIIIDGDLPDPWGGLLGMDYPYNFQTSALDARLNFSHYSSYLFITPGDTNLAAQATNISGADMVLGEVSTADFVGFLGSNGYELLNEYQPYNWQIWNHALNLPGDRMYKVQLPVQPDGDGLSPGLYHLSLSAPGVEYPPNPFVLVSSNLNLTFKLSATQVFVWAVDLRTNDPVPNAAIGVYRSDGTLLTSGVSDENGIFQSAIPAQENIFDTYYAMIGQPGDDNFALSLDNWNEGINGYDFGLSIDYSGPEIEAYVYTDRPIYRPGQTVSFRAVVRQAYNSRYTPANLGALPIKIYDQNNTILLEADFSLSTFGTAHGQYLLSENAQPGTYEISTDYGRVLFDVAEYRKPEINLGVSTSEGAADILADQTIQAQVEARYYFDAPAGDLTLSWNLYKEQDYFYLPGYRVGEESYGWMYPYWMRHYFGYYGEQVASGEGQTDSGGILSIELEIPPEENTQNYTLEAIMTDESGFPVSARTELTIHPAEYYIGVRPDTWLGQAGNQITFDVLTVDWDGGTSPSHDLSAIFQKVTWVREDSDDTFMPPEMIPQYTAVSSADFRTGSDGLARLAFTPPEAGTYQLEIQGADGAVTQLLLWVGGEEQAVWPNLPNQRLRISADKDSYQPGETAQIFIPNPLRTGTQALVTVERGLISRHFTFTLDESGYTLSLPLTEDDAPNVYVSVSLVGNVDFRQGYLNLPVDPAAQELNVQVTAIHEGADVACESGANCPAHLEPRQELTFDLRVTDADGNPVQGEFSLSVADLAALALADPNSIDIIPAFYGEQPLGVNTSMALTMHTQRQLFVPGGMGGGGGGTVAPFVRQKFPDTAYWNAEIVTDANGEAQATFILPDSLTTWHIDIRGLTVDTRVGQAETHVVTSKNLLVRPVTPRFMVVGDRVRISAIVHNNSETDLGVDVALQAAGFALDDPATELQAFFIPAGGRQHVIWWGAVEDADADAVTMIFSASGKNAQGELLYQDITKPVWGGGDIPVVRYLAPQTFGAAGVLDEGGQRLELVSLPRSYDPSSGDLDVELAPSLAAAMTAGLDVLEHYPYECTEQIVSRFLPNLEAYRAIQSLGLDAPELESRLDRTLSDGLDRLVASQNEDGGWGWWPEGESDEFISAYVLFGLSRAKAAGAFVDEAVIQNASNYLMTITSTLWEDLESWRLDRNAFIQYVLVQAGNSGADRVAVDANELYLHRDRLSPWAQAMLAMTLDGLNPDDERVATLFSDLNAAAVRTATGTHWEGGGSRRNMETAVFNSAVVIYALAQDDPASATLPEAVRCLMAHRGARGAWDSTYDTAWTLMALTEVMRGTGELAGDFSFSADVNGSQLAQGQADGDMRLNAVTTSLAVEHLFADHPNALTIQRDAGTGRLYYTAHLNVLRPVEDVASLDAGINIERVYHNLADDPLPAPRSPLSTAPAGNTLEVRLTLTLESETYYLIVEDYIPAGAEILDASLKTSQQFNDEYDPSDPFGDGWGWWYFNDPQIYDDHIAWTVNYLPAGTYELTYMLTLNQPGQYRVIPAQAWQFYFPEVRGNSAGMIFEITE